MTPQLKDIGYASFLNSAKLKVSFKQESKMKIWNRKKKKLLLYLLRKDRSTKKNQSKVQQHFSLAYI